VLKPDISIFGSAHRPSNWMDLYGSIGDNDINFEIVFVGPKEPDFILPNNFSFIKSLVKPTQCIEIAMRNTTADLVMQIADDCEFKNKSPLDRLYNTYKSYNNDKLILSCRFIQNGQDLSLPAHHFFWGDKASPVMPVSGLMSRKLYRDIGGIDRNFIAVQWDLDIAMRVLALGGEVILSDVYLEEQKSKSCGSDLCGEFWHHDRTFLESLWSINGKTHFNRTRPVEPFSDLKIITEVYNHLRENKTSRVTILEESQGPKGRWE
jgi:hypothetical protein